MKQKNPSPLPGPQQGCHFITINVFEFRNAAGQNRATYKVSLDMGGSVTSSGYPPLSPSDMPKNSGVTRKMEFDAQAYDLPMYITTQKQILCLDYAITNNGAKEVPVTPLHSDIVTPQLYAFIIKLIKNDLAAAIKNKKAFSKSEPCHEGPAT